MLKFIKNNKIFSILVLISILTLILSIVTSAILDNDSKELISNNIINLFNQYKSNNISNFNNLYKSLFSNISIILIIWFLGISVIGIPIVVGLYSIKVFIYILEIIFLLINIKRCSLIFIIIYIIPIIINIMILFITLYYSCSYSIVLIRYLTNKKDYNIKKITKKYFKVLLLSLLLVIFSSIFQIFILPKILIFL